LAWFFAGTAFIIFSIIACYHHRLGKGIRRHQIWLEIKKSQLARMDLDWENIAGSMLPYPLSDLSFEKDLDITGSRSYIRNLIGQNGAGLVATHDLELIKLADEFPMITNCHFREKVADGKMVFDYKLRPGPCPTTNALKIMRMEGLPVD